MPRYVRGPRAAHSPHPAARRRASMALAIFGLVAFAGCSDNASAPDAPATPPAAFDLEAPGSLVAGQSFTLTVRALDAGGAPDGQWAGTVRLSASVGRLTPDSVAVVAGAATVQVTLSDAAGTIELRAQVGNVRATAEAFVLSGAPPARLELSTTSAILVPGGEPQTVTVQAFDDAGRVTVVPTLTWTSSRPQVVSVSAQGVLSASAVGSAAVMVQGGGVEAGPILAVAAAPGPGVQLVSDTLFVGDVTAVDADAPYGPGFRYRVRMLGEAPAPGAVIVSSGSHPVAGRVVSTEPAGSGEVEVILELIPLAELFADLKIDEVLPLDHELEPAPAPLPGPWRATNFNLGRFACKASGSLPDLSLPNPSVEITPTLGLVVVYNNGLERLTVNGTAKAEFSYKPKFQATFEGKVTCEALLRTVTVPINGFLSLFFGVQVPLGVGFELDGKLEVAEIGFDVSATATATAELGLDCPGGGACQGVTEWDLTRNVDFKFVSPDVEEQFKVELGARAFVYARPALGTAFLSSAQFEFIDATAGLKQSVDLATALRQAKEDDYASGFRLAFLAKIDQGSDLESAISKLGQLLGTDLSLDLAVVDIDETLAESPKGTLSITPANVEPGDDENLGDLATFKVELDPVTYVGLESVDMVEVVWRKEDDQGEVTLENGRPSCHQITGSSGQTVFECQTDFLEEHRGTQTFHAFVHARLFGVPVPVPLEIAKNTATELFVGAAVCPAPPDWAVPSTSEETDVDPDGGVGTYSMNVSSMQVSVTAKATSTVAGREWFSVWVRSTSTDYVKLVPLDGWPDDGTIYLNFRHVGSARAVRERAWKSGGLCYGDDVEVTASVWNNGLSATPACGEMEGTKEIDEVRRMQFRSWNADDWIDITASAEGYARVRGFENTAEVEVNLTATYEGAEDSQGNPVSVLVCMASGTQF